MINLYFLIIMPILIAVILYLSTNKWVKLFSIILQVFMVAAAIINFIFVKINGEVIEYIGGWEHYAGIALRGDLFACVMVMLTTILFLGMLIFTYTTRYINKLFLLLFVILQSLIIGIFLSNDLFNIYVLIEVGTIIVSILIMFKKDSQAIYDGMVYLLVNIVAMIMFLFGIGFIYKIFGVLDMYRIQELMHLVESPRSLILPYALLITPVALKGALMPLFSWLPKAHGTPSAPSIVSAILSGLYVKGGIYLFIRIQQMFSGVIDTSQYFLILGFLTGTVGLFLALCQTDIKLILAYSTISQIGLIMIGINFNDPNAYWGGIYHIVNHAFFKSTLFLTAGLIIDTYHTRNIGEIRGVFRKMPVVSTISILAILGVTGAPLFNGSISKYLIQSGMQGTFYDYALIFINLGTVVYFMKYITIFFGKDENHEGVVDKYSRSVIVVLGLACFVGGLYGQWFIKLLFNQAVDIDVILYMKKSIVYFLTLVIGVIVYRRVVAHSKLLHRVREIELSFNNICFTIMIFFSVTTVYLMIIY